MTRFTLALAAILLTACNTRPADVGNPPAIVATPASAAGRDIEAQHTLEAAQAIRAQADIAIADATAEARRQADEIEAVTRSAGATSDARSFSLTSAADAIVMTLESDNATATHAAGIAQATGQAEAAATAERAAGDAYAAAQREQRLEEIKQENSATLAMVRAVAFSAIVITFILAIGTVVVVGLMRLFDAKALVVKADAFAKMTRQLQGGAVIRTANHLLEYDPQPIALPPITNGQTVTELEDLGAIPFTANGREQPPIIVDGNSSPEGDIELVKFMLRTGIEWQEQNGAVRDRLPSWNSLASIDSFWTSTRWQKYKAILERAGAVQSTPGVATKTRRARGYGSLEDILHDIESGELDLSPTSETVS